MGYVDLDKSRVIKCNTNANKFPKKPNNVQITSTCGSILSVNFTIKANSATIRAASIVSIDPSFPCYVARTTTTTTTSTTTTTTTKTVKTTTTTTTTTTATTTTTTVTSGVSFITVGP